MAATVTTGPVKPGWRAWLKPAPLIVLILILVLGGVGLYAWLHKESAPKKVTTKSNGGVNWTPKQYESNAQSTVNKYLNEGDAVSYQASQRGLIGTYLLAKDYDNAARIVAEIRKNVSPDKIDSQSYYLFVSVDEARGDKNAEKSDLKLLIARLRVEGDNNAADIQQKKLDSLK